MAVISVPKPPRKAYDPGRRAGMLLQTQLRDLEWAVRPAGRRTPKTFSKIKPAKTEAEAAARIDKLTRELQRQSALPAGAIPPVPATRAPKTGRKSGRKRPTKKRAARPKRRKAAR